MIKKLNTTGNMYYFYFDKTTLALMKLDPGTSKLLIEINDNIMYIKKATEKDLNSKENLFIKDIKRIGSGYGFYFNQSILEYLNLKPETDNVEINIKNNTITLKKAC